MVDCTAPFAELLKDVRFWPTIQSDVQPSPVFMIRTMSVMGSNTVYCYNGLSM